MMIVPSCSSSRTCGWAARSAARPAAIAASARMSAVTSMPCRAASSITAGRLVNGNTFVFVAPS